MLAQFPVGDGFSDRTAQREVRISSSGGTAKRLPMLAASLVLFALNACGGDGPTGTNGNTNVGDGTMSAAINGVAWRSMKSGDKGSHSGQIYAVVGLNGSYTIALGIAGLIAPGTVNVSLATGTLQVRNGAFDVTF